MRRLAREPDELLGRPEICQPVPIRADCYVVSILHGVKLHAAWSKG